MAHSLHNTFAVEWDDTFPALHDFCTMPQYLNARLARLSPYPSADGLILSDTVDAYIINRDGSPGGFSGNGLRILAHLLLPKGHPQQTKLITLNQCQYPCRRVDNEIETDLPVGKYQGNFIVEHAGIAYHFHVIDVGNPHAICTDTTCYDQLTANAAEIHNLLPQIFCQSYFPAGCNVSFAKQENETYHLLTYERGVGYTQACSSAALGLVTLLQSRQMPRPRAIQMPGGILKLSGNQDHMVTLSASVCELAIA